MRELLKEMNERLRHLESQPNSPINDGRIAEMILCIVKVQQIILGGLEAELVAQGRERKIDEIL